MKDKSSLIAIVVVLGICCLGIYVAVSGFLNSNPSALSSLSTPSFQVTSVTVSLPTDTPAPTGRALPTRITIPTALPVPSPLGAFQTITAATTISGPTFASTIPRPASTATASPSQFAMPSCAGYIFCAKGGPADLNLGPTGNECPRNYIWGLVTDKSGKGLPLVRIRHRAPNGEVGETSTKDKPDTPGKYDVLAPSGTFTIWLVEGGTQLSPQVNVTVQPYSGIGNCPMRVDFVKQ